MGIRMFRKSEPEAELPVRAVLSQTSPELPVRDPRLAEYLTRVCTRLPRHLPDAHRRELCRELAAHLEALVDAHLELGEAPDAAVESALRQFGSADEVGRQWSREWKRRVSGVPFGGVAAMVPAFALSLILPVMLTLTWEFDLGGGAGVVGVAALLLPLFAGYRWAFLRETDGSRPVWVACVVGPLASVLLSLAMAARPDPMLLLISSVARLFVWGLVMCGTAGLTAVIKVLRERWSERAQA